MVISKGAEAIACASDAEALAIVGSMGRHYDDDDCNTGGGGRRLNALRGELAVGASA
jgi:hypothetical protein